MGHDSGHTQFGLATADQAPKQHFVLVTLKYISKAGSIILDNYFFTINEKSPVTAGLLGNTLHNKSQVCVKMVVNTVYR